MLDMSALDQWTSLQWRCCKDYNKPLELMVWFFYHVTINQSRKCKRNSSWTTIDLKLGNWDTSTAIEFSRLSQVRRFWGYYISAAVSSSWSAIYSTPPFAACLYLTGYFDGRPGPFIVFSPSHGTFSAAIAPGQNPSYEGGHRLCSTFKHLQPARNTWLKAIVGAHGSIS